MVLRSHLANFSQFWSKFCHCWYQCKASGKMLACALRGGVLKVQDRPSKCKTSNSFRGLYLLDPHIYSCPCIPLRACSTQVSPLCHNFRWSLHHAANSLLARTIPGYRSRLLLTTLIPHLEQSVSCIPQYVQVVCMWKHLWILTAGTMFQLL